MSVSVWVQGDDDTNAFNVANGNWARIVELADLNECVDAEGYAELTGTALVVFHAKVAFALASLQVMPPLDGGVPDEEIPNPGRARIIICGVRPGYFTEKLTALTALAERAIKQGLSLHIG